MREMQLHKLGCTGPINTCACGHNHKCRKPAAYICRCGVLSCPCCVPCRGLLLQTSPGDSASVSSCRAAVSGAPASAALASFIQWVHSRGGALVRGPWQGRCGVTSEAHSSPERRQRKRGCLGHLLKRGSAAHGAFHVLFRCSVKLYLCSYRRWLLQAGTAEVR